MELKDTVQAMLSQDYKERFRAEYHQLKIRYKKLDEMLTKLESETLDFVPSCPFELLDEQRTVMAEYIAVLEVRASIEKINLLNIMNFIESPNSTWISIDDKLPDEGVIVLITDGYKSDVGFYNKESDTFVSDYDFCDDNCVTHWMPLPDPNVKK